ncbi:MAG: hypothetical protein EOP49_13445 [Sphingobacteriales bacterium]|nr:MAG: hypothetical protein EOP49_13445 [Sphingobacteriales bacterium]
MLGVEGMDFLDRMVNASKRMQMLIKNLLAFSRFSTTDDSQQDTNLNTLLDGVLSDLEIQIEQKNASFSIGELPTLSVIPSQFRQLFQNLIINALKFCKDESAPQIAVYAEKIKGIQIPGLDSHSFNEEFFRIYVKDNGIGFDPQYADQIFTVFKRLHSFDKYEGTGIGLSICKKIVEKHHGFIAAEGQTGKGATFIITLPSKKKEIATLPA